MTSRLAGFAIGLLWLVLIVPSGYAQTAQLVPPTGAPILLDVAKGTLIRLDRNADTVFVSDPNIADVQVKSPKLIYLYAKAPGETSLYAVDSAQQVLISRPVIVKRDIAPIQQAINQIVTSGSVDVQPVDGALVLSGTVASAEEAEDIRRIARPFVADDTQLVNHVRVDAPNQVNLRVRVAEVSRTVIKQLGINWDALSRVGNFTLGLATGNPVAGVLPPGGTRIIPEAPSPGGQLPAGIFTRNAGADGTVTNSIVLGVNNGSMDLNSVIDALDQNGLVKLLAEPNLTAMTGETASFLAGGEFPIIVPQSQTQVTVEFKQFGISLAFTPVVLADGRISLRVRPEVSQLSTTGAVQISGFSIPAISTRRAETTIELGSGQSFAIGGLMQNNITDTLGKVPGLGELPVLGALFRSDQFKRDETELVIMVTPYLVRPVSEKQLAAPTDGFQPPNDADRDLLGRNTHPASQPGNPASGPATKPAPAPPG
jgi:pilus assembly protein CpaC